MAAPPRTLRQDGLGLVCVERADGERIHGLMQVELARLPQIGASPCPGSEDLMRR